MTDQDIIARLERIESLLLQLTFAKRKLGVYPRNGTFGIFGIFRNFRILRKLRILRIFKKKKRGAAAPPTKTLI